MAMVKRFEVHLVRLDPTLGNEIQKTRFCAVISPDQMNRHIQTVIAAPMTTRGKKYPTRVECEFEGKQGQIVLNQIRTFDKTRLVKKLGELNEETQEEVLRLLAEMFAK